MLRPWIIISLLLFLYPSSAYSEDGEWVPGVIHLHTKIGEGDGVLSPVEMVKRVKEKGMGIAIINDHDNERVEYGLFPLRKIVKKVVERNSISRYGVKNYLDAVKKAEMAFPDVIVIPGVEAVPVYYWEGSPFDGNLTLKNWHKHILIMGLERHEDMEGLPSVGRGWPVRFGAGCFLNLWPVILLPSGLFLIRYRSYNPLEFSRIRFMETRRPYRIPGFVIFTGGVVFLVNNFPFCRPPYDPYHGDPGIAPYQEVIDYVDARGGLAFWAHPDATFDTNIDKVRVYTPPHPDDLISSDGYTGFAALLEGKKVGEPGGIWDRLLLEYLEGKRKRPVWAIGELDYKDGDWMGETQTVFFIKERTKTEVLKALKEGRVYASSGLPHKPVLKRFEIWDEKEKVWKGMGDTASVGEEVKVRVEVELHGRQELRLRLIRGGKVITSWPLKGVFTTEWVEPMEKGRTYYRIDIDSLLITNPIFVKRVEG
ncbi:MAG: hypothetical protein HY878_04225 [Deltaproteobacteria bacterium]|nr:hypothetical protein [Deltaproteobacteria bacterium]